MEQKEQGLELCVLNNPGRTIFCEGKKYYHITGERISEKMTVVFIVISTISLFDWNPGALLSIL